jgi:hypothetical protein
LVGAFGGEVAEQNLKFENTEKIEREGEEEGEEEPDDGGGLELESPSEGLAGGAQYDEESRKREKGEENTEGKGEAFAAGSGAAFG